MRVCIDTVFAAPTIPSVRKPRPSLSNDSSEYLDWSAAQRAVLPNLKPTAKTISLRLPQRLLDSIDAAAMARDVPYQSLIEVWLQEKVHGR